MVCRCQPIVHVQRPSDHGVDENPRTAAALADAAANEMIAVNDSSDAAQLKQARAVIHPR